MDQSTGIIPTIILTGFLGAGKTTLLNRLIDYYKSKRTVLLINEFGQIGVDGALLKQGSYEKVELNKGSLFCICVRTDFIDEVERIARDIKPELLLIEATGLADTSEMEKMLNLPNLKPYINLRASVCIVDCTTFLKISKNLKAPVSQVKSADLVLLNKLDRVDKDIAERTRQAVEEIVADVQIVDTLYADVPAGIIDRIRRPHKETSGEVGEGRPDPVISVTLKEEGEFSREKWERFTDTFKKEAMRTKGFVTIEGDVYLIDAGMEEWKEHKTDKARTGENTLVIIGQEIDEDEIQQRFHALLESPE
jgi:G3E family GTPase